MENGVSKEFVAKTDTTIFADGSFVMTLDKFIELLNSTLQNYANRVKDDPKLKDCSVVCMVLLLLMIRNYIINTVM